MSDKRTHIVETAYNLFYENGFHATGVDTLMAQAHVSKRTLYRYFRSKAELIAATLDHHNESTLINFRNALGEHGGSAKDRILSIFDVEEELFCSPSFSGCYASNALAEFAGKDSKIEESYRRFKDDLEGFIHELCVQACMREAHVTARKIAMVLDGAIAYARMHNAPEIARDAKEVVSLLLESSLND